MNLSKRLSRLESIIRESDGRPVIWVFAVIGEDWQFGYPDRDFTGVDFELYFSNGEIPDLAKIGDLEELKKIAYKNMIDLYVLPVGTLEDVWAEERQELESS
jgi:hypothetical protein